MTTTNDAPAPAPSGSREAELVRAASALLNNLWQETWSHERTHEENWKAFDRKFPGVKWLRDARDASLASDATPATSAETGASVGVKELEWHRVTYGWLAFEEWYRIEDNGTNWSTDRYWLYERGERLGKFGSLEAAQAAMQVRHDARIRSALASEGRSDG